MSSSLDIFSGPANTIIVNDAPVESLLIDSKGHGSINRENHIEPFDGRFRRNDKY